MSFERVSGPLHFGPWFGRTLGRPAIWSAVVYARVRYGVDLFQPDPLKAVAHSTVPVLLIHGEDDRNIAPRHSRLIAAAAPNSVTLWLVPHAAHTMAWAVAHSEFENRLLGWFASQSQPRPKVFVNPSGRFFLLTIRSASNRYPVFCMFLHILLCSIL